MLWVTAPDHSDWIYKTVENAIVTVQSIRIDGVPRDTSFTLNSTYLKERKYRSYIEPVKACLPENVLSHENISYKTVENKWGEHDLKMNVYRPDDQEEYPVLLMIHGGGWNSGSLDLQVPMAQRIASKGYVTVPVEYRLIPEALYPAGVEDLEDAIHWIYKNASKYGIDKNRIAVSGCSAGGQLAMLLGTKNKSGKIRVVINMDGISSFVTDESVDRAQQARDENKPLPVDAIWLGGTYQEKPENWEEASALSWVTKKSVPVCFINSSIPRFHNGRDEVIALLDSYGIYTEVHTFEDSPHTYWFFHPWFDKTIGYMTRFLDKVLKNRE
jgi:pectinesterase